jgi:hypothetical protein
VRLPSLVAASAVSASLLAAAAPAGRPPRLDLTLRPVAGGGGAIEAVDVTLSGNGIAADPAHPLARLPLVVNNVDTIAAEVNVDAWDLAGPLPLNVRVEGEELGAARVWVPARPVVGGWSLHYRRRPHR